MKKGLLIFGVILVVTGAVVLAYQGITYTTRDKVLKIGPVEATKKSEKTLPLPPIVGGSVVVAGIILVVSALKKS